MTQGKGYSLEIDYWAIGVLLYEFLCGKLPFGDKLNDPFEIFREVRRKKLFYPAHISKSKHKDTIGLIDSLLEKDPARRLENGW